MKSSSKEAVKQFLLKHPEYNHRKWQYHIAGLIAGVTPEQAEIVSTALRRMRDLIPNDAKGEQLAQEWRIENGKDHIFDHIDKQYENQPEKEQFKVVMVNGVKYRVKA